MESPTGDQADSKKDSTLDQYFGEEVKKDLLEDDRLAWKYVCGLLFSIVFGGVLLGLFGTLLSAFMLD